MTDDYKKYIKFSEYLKNTPLNFSKSLSLYISDGMRNILKAASVDVETQRCRINLYEIELVTLKDLLEIRINEGF